MVSWPESNRDRQQSAEESAAAEEARLLQQQLAAVEKALETSGRDLAAAQQRATALQVRSPATTHCLCASGIMGFHPNHYHA